MNPVRSHHHEIAPMAKRAFLATCLFTAMLILVNQTTAEDPPKAAEPGTLIVIDPAGKEQKIKTWKFAAGTRRLTWLVPAPPPEKEPEDKTEKNGAKKARPATKGIRPAVGPEALEFREENSTSFVEGILTLVPLDRIKSIDYDGDKDLATVKVATGKPDADETLTGSTRFKGINKLVLEADVDRGDLGIAEIRLQGGVPKGFKGLRFPPAKVEAPAPGGRPATVITADRMKKATHKVTDLQPLYRLPSGHEQLLPILMFKKTLKLDVSKINKLVLAPGEPDEERSFQVTLKDGGDETLILLRTIPVNGQAAELEGLLGKVPAGWKFFPIHTLGEVIFDGEEGK